MPSTCVPLQLRALCVLALCGALNAAPASDGAANPYMGQRHELPGVFCVDFDAESAQPVEAVFTQGGAVHVARVVYPDRLAFVVASTLPAGRAPADDLTRQLDTARALVAATEGRVDARQIDSPLGPVVAVHMRDVAETSPRGDFPLDRVFHDRPLTDPPVSIAASRLFVRGADRIEVAILAGPGGTTDNAITARHAQVDAWANALLASMQACTASIPLRKAD